MNVVGRQMHRSSASTANHQRKYPDNVLESTSNGRWIQSTGAQSNSSFLSSIQGYDHFDVSVGSKLHRTSFNDFPFENELFLEPLSPTKKSHSINFKNFHDDLLPRECSPGLLDLHSFNTELISEVPSNGLHDITTHHKSIQNRSFDYDSEPYLFGNKDIGGAHGHQENSYMLKSTTTEKEKTATTTTTTPAARIKVVVRKRPLNKKELAKNDVDIVETHLNSLTVHETKLKVDLTEYVEKHEFLFDSVLNEEVSNDEVYQETVEPVVPTIFHRAKATCFAYGQTGSGKTYTMKPLPFKAARDILRLMHHTYRNQGFLLFVSFFEIYGGKLFDLLNDRRKLCMREDGKQKVCIVGLQEHRVSDVEMIKDLIDKGNAARSTGTTGVNEESSRSHGVLQLAIKRPADGDLSRPLRPVGKLSFIDLAGSERGADTTDNDRQTRMEGAEINKSLLALKECIRALDNDRLHIPFRGSKLTEVLRDSFVGDSRTVMISCISPNSASCEHTLNTLRYADRVKSLSKAPSNNNAKKLPVLPAATTHHHDHHAAYSDDDDELNDLLREEEDLINAHRMLVEETMNVVKEEMEMLIEADSGENELEEYVSRLSAILTLKASRIVRLQARLTRFQNRLRDHQVLITHA